MVYKGEQLTTQAKGKSASHLADKSLLERTLTVSLIEQEDAQLQLQSSFSPSSIFPGQVEMFKSCRRADCVPAFKQINNHVLSKTQHSFY